MKCEVCGKEGAKKIAIMDGYMDSGKFEVCPSGCYRTIVQDGVAFWLSKRKERSV